MVFSRKKQSAVPARRRETSVRATPEDLAARYNFRRNRTLTGSLSSSVASATEQRAELKSDRVHAHGLRRHRRRLGLFIAGVVLVSAILLTFVYQSIAIVHVASLAPKRIQSALYESKIQEYLTIHPLERSRLFLDTTKLTAFLQRNDCPEIQEVLPDMRFDGFGSSKLTLVFRQAAVSWKTTSQQLYVDETGAAFSRNYYPDPKVTVIDKTGITTRDNQVLASNRFLGYIGVVIGKMRQYGFQTTSVTLPEGTTRQIALGLDGIQYPIKMSVDRPAGEQAEDAMRAIKYLQSKGMAPDYIDVRVGGKAYYKD